MADATFPWADAMAFGLGKLKLTARDFWTMTPRELAAAADGYFGARTTPLARPTLDDLMQRYPDGKR